MAATWPISVPLTEFLASFGGGDSDLAGAGGGVIVGDFATGVGFGFFGAIAPVDFESVGAVEFEFEFAGGKISPTSDEFVVVEGGGFLDIIISQTGER